MFVMYKSYEQSLSISSGLMESNLLVVFSLLVVLGVAVVRRRPGEGRGRGRWRGQSASLSTASLDIALDPTSYSSLTKVIMASNQHDTPLHAAFQYLRESPEVLFFLLSRCPVVW
jgi:hypothetical protein